MGLPVNVPYHPETETPVSLVSRLARAMGFASIDELVRSGGTTVHAVARGEDDAMRTLSSWSGVSTDRLRRFAVPMRGEAGEWRLGDAVFRKEMRVAGRFRFCPRCLVEDVENGSGRPQSRPFVRAAWLTRAVMACTRHGELLVEGGEDAPENDVAMFTAKAWHLECQPGGSADDAELAVDAYIEGRVTGNRTESFIDRQEVHVLLMLFHFIGWLLHNHLPSFIVGGKAASSHSVRAAGYLVTLGGREAIEMVVRQAVDLHRPAAHNTTEFFGPMVRRLRHNAAVPAYAEAVGLFQDLVERLCAGWSRGSFHLSCPAAATSFRSFGHLRVPPGPAADQDPCRRAGCRRPFQVLGSARLLLGRGRRRNPCGCGWQHDDGRGRRSFGNTRRPRARSHRPGPYRRF